MQLERHEIRVFTAVVEEQGFGRAAERLSVSQSAVSQAIANLEHKLDVQLLLRKKQPELTEAGKRVYRFTQMVMNEEQSALDDVEQIRSGALSTLSLAMNSTFNRFYGLDILLQFCERNPLVRLQLQVVPSREIVYGVNDGRWELGIGPFQTNMPGHFELRGLFAERRSLVVHESNPLCEQLMQDPVAALAQCTLLTSFLDDAAKRPGNERIRHSVARVWEVGNLELRLAMAEAGKGLLYLSDRVLRDLPGMRKVEGLEFSAFDRQVGLYYNKHKALSEGAKRFVALCDAAQLNKTFS